MKESVDTAAVLLLVGEDTFRMEEELSRLKAGLGQEASLNLACYHAEDQSNLDEVIELCNTLPFLAPRRLIILRNVERLKGRALTAMEAYLGNPCSSTTLVLTASGGKGALKALGKALPKDVPTRRFDPLKGPPLTGWIQERARAHAKEIERDAAFLLAEILGADTWFLATEIDKLCLYAGREKAVTLHDVEELVLRSREANIFAFSDALFNRKREALLRLSELEAAGVEMLQILGLLENQILQHYQVLCAARDAQAGIHPYAAKKIAARKSLWNAQTLEKLLSDVRDIEHRIKTGRCLQPFVSLAYLTGGITGPRDRLSPQGTRPALR